jgi:hypothetical protein
MKSVKRIFFVDDQKIVPVAEEAYNAMLENRPVSDFYPCAGRRLKTADIEIDPDQMSPKGILKIEFRYSVFDADGRLDEAAVQSYFDLRTLAAKAGRLNDPQSEFRKKHCWTATAVEFKSIMKLSLTPDAVKHPVTLSGSKKVPYDRTNLKVDSLCKLIGTFPGLEVVGNNLAVDRWSAIFDVVEPSGLVSIIFLTEGLKLDMVQDLNLLLNSPDKDMRYTLSAPQNRDIQKISLWLIHLYQKRLDYKRTF